MLPKPPKLTEHGVGVGVGIGVGVGVGGRVGTGVAPAGPHLSPLAHVKSGLVTPVQQAKAGVLQKPLMVHDGGTVGTGVGVGGGGGGVGVAGATPQRIPLPQVASA
jgi:hypothetical protein